MIQDTCQKFVFLNNRTPKQFTLLANLTVAPDTLDTKTFDELVQILTTHFEPNTSVISERCSFHCRNQEPHESIAQFVAALKFSANMIEHSRRSFFAIVSFVGWGTSQPERDFWLKPTIWRSRKPLKSPMAWKKLPSRLDKWSQRASNFLFIMYITSAKAHSSLSDVKIPDQFATDL